jgi:acyl-CoA thioesterase-1
LEKLDMLSKRLLARTFAYHNASQPESERRMVPQSAQAEQGHRRALTALVVALLALAGRAHAQIVAFGANNFAGANVAATAAIPAQLQLMLRAKGYGVTVLNAAVYGNTTADMRTRLERDIPARTAIVVLDTSGGLYNDTLKGISRAQGMANLAAIKARLAARNIKVIPFSAAFIPPQYHQPDGVHLTPEGHRLAASNLMVPVTQALGAAPVVAQSLPQTCLADARRWCPAAAEGEGRRRCLREHRGRVSRDCLRDLAVNP